jgi:Legionella pneumophila major outer membrane protein precursor
MARLSCLLVVLPVLVGIPPAPQAFAQTQKPPSASPAPVPSTATEPDVLPGLPRPPDAPGSLLREPAAPSAYSCDPLPGPYFERDPRLDPPPLPPPGWFTDVDVGVVGSHVKNRLREIVLVGSRLPETVHLPAAELEWTIGPRIELGYRLPSGFGEFAVAYRFFATDGSGSVLGPDGIAALKSRLAVNMVDVHYASREISLWPHCDMKWRFGLRWADAFFDSRAEESFAAAAAGSGIFQTRVSNNFWGVGPHVGLELAKRFPGSGLSLVGWADGATLLGRIRQNLFEASTSPGADGQLATGNTRLTVSQDVPIVSAFLGLGWQPPRYPCSHVFLGYHYEYWWNVGRNSSTLSRGELGDQGPVLRAEINF